MQVTGRRWRMPFARWTMSQPGAWGCLGPGREHPERAAPVELPLLVSFASKASGFAVGGAEWWPGLRAVRPLVSRQRSVVSRGGRKQEHGG